MENGNLQFNIGYHCSTRQCESGLGAKIAFRAISHDLQTRDITFSELDEQSNRFANVLKTLGFSRGDVFFAFLPKCPELFGAILGSLKMELITGSLFSNMGTSGVRHCLEDSRAKIILTKRSLLRKIRDVLPFLPELRVILLIDEDTSRSSSERSFPQLMAAADKTFAQSLTPAECPSMLHYTSGSTGRSKGVLHCHGGLVQIRRTATEVLNLRPDDRYWCTADQGWVTGISYGIFGPWSNGVTQIHYSGPFQAKRWFDVLERERVSVLYTAPTALRMIMREDPSSFAGRSLEALRHIFSVGEPLNPEIIRWADQMLGKKIFDSWFQTETGSIMIANRPDLPIKPGSMGKPVGGIEGGIADDSGHVLPAMAAGHLCVRRGWPSMFVDYLNNHDLYQKRFRGEWYVTGDSAYADNDGYFWFLGREDDIINTAGHLVSPFEIESALLELGEVMEAAAVGVPDAILHEKVVVFIRLREDLSPGRDVELKVRTWVSNRLSTVATPQEIRFVESIPKNKSGKILRRVLKAQFLGLDPGDLSTLDGEHDDS